MNEQQLSSFQYQFVNISICRETFPESTKIQSTYKTVKVTSIVQIKVINKLREYSLYSLVLKPKPVLKFAKCVVGIVA